MMAASVIENGSSLKVEVHNSPNSMHNDSLHDPNDDSNPASPTTAGYMGGDPSDDLEEARTSSHKLHRSLSSAGKQLAESSTLGPKAGKLLLEFPSELSLSNSSIYSDDSIDVLTGEEAKIALDQLQELEVAIKERKDTRVDGRKTRWVVYREKKEDTKSNNTTESTGNLNSSSESEPVASLDDLKVVKKETKFNYKTNELKAFSRSKSNSDLGKSEESPQSFDDTSDIYSTNNNSNIANNFNHSDDTSIDAMKVEDTGLVLGPIETNNVLETMKQQFLEGTCNISESSPVAAKEKKTKKKKCDKLDCSNDENVKRKPGRPKKKDKSVLSSTPKQEANSSDLDISLPINDQECDSFTPIDTDSVTPKKENQLGLTLSPDFYLRKNPVTRGLREVRKSESGSESNSSTPVKDTSLHLQLSPASPSLSLSPNALSPLKYDKTNGTTKFPLIGTAAKALMFYDQEQESNEDSNSFVKKPSRNDNIISKNKLSPLKVQTENGIRQDENCSLNQFYTKKVSKRGRGRKKGSWPKKTSMIVADVHNSMNGEPQAVIKTSTVSRKKKPPKVQNQTVDVMSAGSSLNESSENQTNNKEKDNKPAVPATKLLQSSQESNMAPAISAYDNSTKKISSKTINNYPNLDIKNNPHENGNSITLGESSNEKINLDSAPVKSSLMNNGAAPECDHRSSINNGSTISKNSILPDKKQKSILDYTTHKISKVKASLPLLIKSVKLSPNKFLCESIENDSVSSTIAGNSITMSNGDQSLDGSFTSVSQTLSPEKSLILSPDKQKKDKWTKNKSLNDVIEKLHKPMPKLNSCKETELLKSGSDFGDDINFDIKDEKLFTSIKESFTEEGCLELPDSGKVKKPPRFLTELFKDEGVQLMLGSMKPVLAEGRHVLDSSQHKLRPKRINDNVSESPEPEESLQKRKKRQSEVDNLFVDEGALNLLTSIESTTRRPSFTEDTPIECINKPMKTNISTLKVIECKKRKLSGASNSSGGSLKAMMPNNKRLKLSLSQPKVPFGSDIIKKKVGRPSNADLLKKKQLQETHSNLQQNQLKMFNQKPLGDIKSVPPIKIKLTSNEDGSTRPSISPSHQVKPSISPNEKPTTSKPSVNESDLKMVQHMSLGSRTISSFNQPRVHGVPLKKLLPAGALKTMKIGLIKPVDKDGQSLKVHSKVEVVRQSQRASLRNNEVNNHFRDIHLRKFNHFMQIIFNPSTTKMKNSFNSKVLRELCEALNYIKKDASVNLVLFTATGSTFCQGIDLTSLQHSNLEIRKKNAANLTRGIKEFLHCLITFPKVIVAGINGSAAGLGVTMLPLFDLVIASDKVEFSLPYGELGQVPEGGATYTFPQYYGKLQSNNLFMGRKISACQAQSMGLVSETLWHNTFIQELIPKVAAIASHPSPGLEATKALMNHHLMTKLELSVETECRALLQHWGSQNFAVHCKRYLESNYILYQSPAFRQNQ